MSKKPQKQHLQAQKGNWSVDPFLQNGLDRIAQDYAFLVQCFQEVLTEVGQPRLATLLKLEPRQQQSALDLSSVQVLSIAFQLLNLVEENTANQISCRREADLNHPNISGTWRDKLQNLSKGRIAALPQALRQTEVDVVLTAHPTESKKWSTLNQHRELYRNLVELGQKRDSSHECETIRNEVKSILERLWRTGEIPARKPEIAAERQTAIYYLSQRLPQAIRLHDQRLQQALKSAYPQGRRVPALGEFPQINFGTWVGGDRDGHPFVTSTVTQETLNQLRSVASQFIACSLERLSNRIPFSRQNQSESRTLRDRLNELRGRDSTTSTTSPPLDEPWREYVSQLRKRVPRHPRTSSPAPYARATELGADLKILEQSLLDVRADRIVDAEVRPVMRELEVFGFHLAKLDFRQNSAYLEQAFVQLLEAEHPKIAEEFPNWQEPQKQRFLTKELQSTRPFAQRFASLGAEATETLESLRVCLDTIRVHGRAGIGSFIVSMTRQVSDLLIAYVMCREAGLVIGYRGKPVCLLPIVPLLETQDDLDRGPEIVAEFLAQPLTKRSQRFWDRTLDDMLSDSWLRQPRLPRKTQTPRQQVMVGYSDSNKDCGIIASLWSVRRAQVRLLQLGQDLGVNIQIFHGRGGTISRGAGPTHRFLDALPGGATRGGLRLTEQGESVGQKYGNVLTAAHNLEQLLAGTFACHIRDKDKLASKSLNETIEFLCQTSSETYRRLVRHAQFQIFFYQATPVDVLQHTRIGSRPVARTGKRSIEDIRAIPWTFAWNQARYYLPGWYGAGTALEALHRQNPKMFKELSGKLQQVPFVRYLFFNLEASLESADVEIMGNYATLVSDQQLRQEMLTTILAEHQRTHRWLQKLFKTPIRMRRPRFFHTLHARDEGLRRLHAHQIKLLKRWRKTTDDLLLNELLVVVNAIASGQRTTG